MKNNVCYQGDCLEVMKGVKDGSIDLVLTDPPYGMSYKSNHRKDKYDKIKNDENLDWLPELSKELFRVSKNNTHLYVFCSFHNIDIFKQEFEKNFTLKNILIWEKNNTSMGDLFGDYAPKYEMILYLNKGRKLLNNGRDPNIIKFNRTGNKLHPTEKPVDMFEYLINKSTNENDIVLDCFAGSGTTGVAAKNLNRNFILIEQDEKYCEVIKERVGCEIIKPDIEQKAEIIITEIREEIKVEVKKNICPVCGGKIKGRYCEDCFYETN